MSRRKVIDLARRLALDEANLLELFAERAAIRELEGGASRADAEAGAYEDLRERYDDVASDALLAGPRRGPKSATVAVDVEDADEDVG